jgi:hypothetical protein
VTRLRDGRLRNRDSIPEKGRKLSFLHSYQIVPDVQPISYPICSGGYFPEVMRPGHETDHSHSSSAEVTNAWNYASTPSYFFMTLWLIKDNDNFIIISLIMKRILFKNLTPFRYAIVQNFYRWHEEFTKLNHNIPLLKWQESGENCIMRNFITCTPHQT